MTPDDAARITELRAQGLQWREVAAQLGVCQETLRTHRHRFALPVDRRNRIVRRRKTELQCAIEAEFDEPLEDVIFGLRDLVYSWRTVAGALGIYHRTLYNWRKARGMLIDARDVRHDIDPVADAERHTTDRLRGTSGRGVVRDCDNIPDAAEWLGGRHERR